MEFRKPYTTDEIQKKPWAVIVSLLIGLLLITTGGWITESRIAKRDNALLRDKADSEKQARIEMYEEMIFLRRENSQLKSDVENTDSTLRTRTSPYVHKILRRP